MLLIMLPTKFGDWPFMMKKGMSLVQMMELLDFGILTLMKRIIILV